MTREDLPDVEEIRAAIRTAQEHGATVEVVGSWPWAEFDAKPDEGTRAEMSAAGWRWSRKKARWYLRTTESGLWHRASYADLCARHGVGRAPDISEEREAAPAGSLF